MAGGGSQYQPNPSSEELVQLMRDLARRYTRLVSRISKVEEVAGIIELELLATISRLEKLASEGPQREASAWKGSELALERTDINPLRRLAQYGVGSIDIKCLIDGSFEVSIDGGKSFRLSTALGELLSVLVLDTGRSEDDKVGWKSLDEAAILVSKRLGRRVTRHALTQNLYRLRKEMFRRGGINPFLVQVNRNRGVRFGVRRRAKPVIEVTETGRP